jgi:metallo-beta-lactamase class B
MIMAALGLVLAASAMADDGQFHCTNCKAWNEPHKPFKVYGNTWYVGTKGLSALLVTSPSGHILLDGGLPQSAPQIAANIKSLGFRLQDVKLILNSHAHFDHAGGIAALQRATGATVVASAPSARTLQDGVIGKDDPQYDPAQDPRIEKIASVRVVADGEVVRVGELALTARMTPGHTKGSTSWTWTSCENQRCLNMVFADSLTAISADGFRFSDSPERVAEFKATYDKVDAFACDVVLTTHAGVADVIEKADAKKGTVNPFIDPNACHVLVTDARERFAARLASETKGAPGH